MDDETWVAEGRGTGALVLVVDADPMFGVLVEACIGFEGASVTSAASVASARGLVSDALTGLVIEPNLPDGDGHELLELIEKHCPGVPIVVCVEPGAPLDPTHPGWPGSNITWLDKGDLARMVQVLGLADEPAHLPEDRLLHISALDVTGLDDVIDLSDVRDLSD